MFLAAWKHLLTQAFYYGEPQCMLFMYCTLTRRHRPIVECYCTLTRAFVTFQEEEDHMLIALEFLQLFHMVSTVQEY